MTPKTKALLDRLIEAINFRNVITTIFTGVVMWVGTIMFTSFQKISTRINTDHEIIKMIAPAVRTLQKADSARALKENSDAINAALINAKMAEIGADLKELKPLIYKVINQTK